MLKVDGFGISMVILVIGMDHNQCYSREEILHRYIIIDIKKVAVSKTKPYQLVERKSQNVGYEDGLDNLHGSSENQGDSGDWDGVKVEKKDICKSLQTYIKHSLIQIKIYTH